MKDWKAFFVSIIVLLFWITPVVEATLDIPEEAAYLNAIQQFNEKDWEKSRISFMQFQQQFPKSKWESAVQLRLADLEENPEKALKSYHEIITRSPNSEWGIDARFALGKLYFLIGQYQAAANTLEVFPNNCETRLGHALLFTGIAYINLKNHSKANACFNKILKEFSKSDFMGSALIGLGISALEEKKFSLAVTFFEKYCNEFPDGDFIQTALLLKADALMGKNIKGSKTEILSELISRYSTGYEAEQARKMIAESEKQLVTIQVGSFSKREFALKLLRQLIKKGYNAYLLDSLQKNGRSTHVRIGVFDAKNMAEKTAAKLLSEDKLPSIIIPYIKPDK